MKLLVCCAQEGDAFVEALEQHLDISLDVMLDPETDSDDWLFAARHGDYSAVVMMCNIDDTHWHRKTIEGWRRNGMDLPLAVVTRTIINSDPLTKLYAAGADVIECRPIQPEVFLAHLAAVVRRWQGRAREEVEFGDGFVINFAESKLRYKGRAVHVPKSRFKILSLMTERLGTVVTRDAILRRLYDDGADTEPDVKILDVFVCNLRKRFREVCGEDVIETVWGRGYRIPKPGETGVQIVKRGRDLHQGAAA